MKYDRRTEEWLERRGISRAQMEAVSWRIFQITVSTATVIAIAAFVLIGAQAGIYTVIPGILLSLSISLAFRTAPSSFANREERMMMRESPTVVGAMTMSMQLQPSIERGLSFAAEHCEGVLSDRLREVMWRPLTRASQGLVSSLVEFAESLGEFNESLRQSLYLIMSSSRERTKEGVNRLLDRANAIVLNGVRENVDKYVASLSMPTMVLFALGILLPVMLFSIMPLLSVSTTFELTEADYEYSSGSGIQTPMLAILLLLVFPVSSLYYARSTLSRSPLRAYQGIRFRITRRLLAAMAIWVASILTVQFLGLGEAQPYAILLAVAIPMSCLLYVRCRREHDERKARSRGEKDFVSAIYQVGNRMASGSSFETALDDAAKGRTQCAFAELVNLVKFRSMMSNSSAQMVLSEEIRSANINPLLGGALKIIAECSERNPAGAGRVALNLAQYLSDLKSCESKIAESLRGLVDMMRSTSMIFAPIVLGITSSLVGILSDYGVSSSSLLSGTIVMVGLYIVELAAIVSYFTVFLSSEGNWNDVGYEFGKRVPIALAVFISTSILCQFGLTRLL